MKSLSDKMREAYQLSNVFDFTEGFSEADYDFISGWQDGLVHKYAEKRMTGHCSLQAMIDFDIEAFENEVDADIKRLRELKQKRKELCEVERGKRKVKSTIL